MLPSEPARALAAPAGTLTTGLMPVNTCGVRDVTVLRQRAGCAEHGQRKGDTAETQTFSLGLDRTLGRDFC